MTRSFDVCVVGSGVFGAWTAHFLAEAGARVALVDAWGAGHNRSSSGGESRILRAAYADDPLYARFAWRSLPHWRALSERHGGGLVHRTGVLWLASPGDPKIDASHRTLAALGIPVEPLSLDEIARRHPAFALDGLEDGLFEPEGSVAIARRAVHALAGELGERGVETIRARVWPVHGSAPIASVATDSGRISADRFVLAAGPWLGELAPGALAGRFFPTRQSVAFFGVPAGDARWEPPQLPVWLDGHWYGFPSLEHRGFKIARHEVGEAFDPTDGVRAVRADEIEAMRAFLSVRFPAIANAPVVETRVCVYENSADANLLVDRHPEIDNVWLVGCGSGHGFKHGPAVGELAARLVLENRAVDEPRLSIAGKGTELLHQTR